MRGTVGGSSISFVLSSDEDLDLVIAKSEKS